MKFVVAWVLSALFFLAMFNWYSTNSDKFNERCRQYQGHVESSFMKYSCVDAANQVIFGT